jgi:hypothetical protein
VGAIAGLAAALSALLFMHATAPESVAFAEPSCKLTCLDNTGTPVRFEESKFYAEHIEWLVKAPVAEVFFTGECALDFEYRDGTFFEAHKHNHIHYCFRYRWKDQAPHLQVEPALSCSIDGSLTARFRTIELVPNVHIVEGHFAYSPFKLSSFRVEKSVIITIAVENDAARQVFDPHQRQRRRENLWSYHL